MFDKLVKIFSVSSTGQKISLAPAVFDRYTFMNISIKNSFENAERAIETYYR